MSESNFLEREEEAVGEKGWEKGITRFYILVSYFTTTREKGEDRRSALKSGEVVFTRK